MIQSNSQIRSAACAALKGHWLEAAMLTFVYMLIAVLVSCIPFVGRVASLLLIPMGWGFAVAFLRNGRGADDPFNISCLFDGYKDFVRIFTTLFLSNVYAFLWALLLIVPGIIKQLSYAMTPYILADKPELNNNKAIELSMAMMEGHKMDLFLMNLIFLCWGILCIFTLGIGYFWLCPYMQASYAKFYEEVKAEYEQNGTCCCCNA